MSLHFTLSAVFFPFWLYPEAHALERVGVRRKEKRELEKIDTSSQKPSNQLLYLWRGEKNQTMAIHGVIRRLQPTEPTGL